MFNPADPSNKAYWIAIPYEYLPAVGSVIAQWGYFEMQFAGFITILSRHPEAGKFGTQIPRSFGDKAKRLRRLARLAFADTPTLVEKICNFSIRANETSLKRNVIAHGFWFDMSHFDPNKGVEIATEPDGTGDFYTVKFDQLERLASKIGELKLEGILLHFPPPMGGSLLTEPELSALQAFHSKYPGLPPDTPICRDPSRKGSPQSPEPFQA